MSCKEIRESLPDIACGLEPASAQVEEHLRGCTECAQKLNEFRQTMSLLDEWQAPEPSPYFDTRLQARLREEMARPQWGWLGWLRKPALVVALTLLLGVGVSLFRGGAPLNHSGNVVTASAAPGTPVGDLQTLDKNHDMLADFDLLDDVQVQPDVNP
jgi:anti-sigma factor RsiW